MADSNDLLRRIARVGADIDPALSDRDVERLVAGARRRRQRRTFTRVGAGTLAAGLATLAVFILLQGRQPAPPAPADVAVAGASAPAAAVAVAPAPLRLADGSVATPLDEGSALAVREDAPQRVAIDLVRGRGRFEVAPRPERPFSVRAGDVTITVLGTVFTVERVADRIGVSVARGRVLVDWGVGSRRLEAGESGWFPPLVVGQQAAPASEPAPAPIRPPGKARAVVARADDVPARVAPPSQVPGEAAPLPNPLPAPRGEGTGSDLPLPLAGEGRGEGKPPEAPRALPAPRREAIGQSRVQVGPVPAAETAETLLAAADAARLQGRAEEGAALLRRIVQQHRADPRAPLAAFTLGRVLLMELAQPRQAAAAFAEARALAPHGPFAEDALAREAEAWAKAGDDAKARARAQDYLRAYPSGRRVPAVRALGGGE